MTNSIKYSTTGDTLSLKKGNIFFGVGDVGKGPSSATTYYNGVTPVSDGYTIYIYNNSQTSNLSYHSASNDVELILFTNGISGQNFSTATQCLNWYATQTNYVCVNKDYETISTNSLTVCLDASFTPSYPKSGTTFYNLANTASPLTFTMNNGVSYSTDANGSLLFDGVDDEVVSNLAYTATSAMTWNVWFKRTSDGNVFNMVMSNFMPYLAFRGTGSAGDTNEFQIAYRSVTGASQTQRNLYTTTKYQNNIWYNVTFTLFYDLPNLNSTAKIYVNGVLETSVSYYSDSIYQVSSGNRLRIGNYIPSAQYPFPGYIGSFFVYDRVLSDSEVLQTYNSLKSRFQESFDPDAQAFITAAGITDPTQQNAINQLVLDLKSYNIWSSMVAIYPFVGGTANTNKYNLKNTSTYTLSFGGGWTHSLTGSLPNGTNAYADTGISPSSVLGSSHNYSVYSRTNSTLAGTIIGSYVIGGYTCGESGFLSELQLYLRTSNFLLVRDQPNGNYVQISNTSSLGYYIVNRTGTLTVYKNGTSIGSSTVSQSLSYVTLSLGASNVYDEDCGYGYNIDFDDKEISFATFANASLTSTNISNLNTAVQAFQTTLGRQV